MGQVLIEDAVYEKVDFREKALPKGDYEYCSFTGCDFSNGDLSGCRFLECTFTECNLSLVKLNKTSFRDIKFAGSKMMGLRFDMCNEFGLSFSFDNCVLDHSSFYKTNLRKIKMKDTRLHEVDFTDSDLAAATLDNCDLLRATFDNTILEKADLVTAYNYSIDPDRNKIKKAKFALSGIAGLLDKYDIDIKLAG